MDTTETNAFTGHRPPWPCAKTISPPQGATKIYVKLITDPHVEVAIEIGSEIYLMGFNDIKIEEHNEFPLDGASDVKVFARAWSPKGTYALTVNFDINEFWNVLEREIKW
jgi:hypothetical protein